MSLRSKIETKWLMFKLSPLLKSQEVSFKKKAAGSAGVLLLFPGFKSKQEASTLADLITSTFGSKNIIGLTCGCGDEQAVLPGIKTSQLNQEMTSAPKYRELEQDDTLKILFNQQFDIFIDLSANESLLIPFLCYRCRFPIRISMQDHPQESLFNVQLNTKDPEVFFRMIGQLIGSK